MNPGVWYRTFATEGPHNLGEWALWLVLWPFSFAYGAAQRIRAGLYRRGWLKRYRASVPVLSVGNLIAGGTGKTPVVHALVCHALQQNKKVAVVSRGYGGSPQQPVYRLSAQGDRDKQIQLCGDEPVWLARTEPECSVYVAARRVLGVQQAETDGAELIILDDGYQHLAVQRDCDLLLQDARYPQGNGHVLPAGLLREPVHAENRASMILRTRCDELPRNPAGEVGYCQYALSAFTEAKTGAVVDVTDLVDKSSLAVAGIAQPFFFFEQLERLGLPLVHALALSDHAAYDQKFEKMLCEMVSHYRPQCLIVTEKDGVKLNVMSLPVPVYIARLSLRFAPEDFLLQVLNSTQRRFLNDAV